jgi:hypothetical protein
MKRTEPATIPMSGMVPGEWGVIVASPESFAVGEACFAGMAQNGSTFVGITGKEVRLPGVLSDYSVRLLQPGDSITVERLADEAEPTTEAVTT